jgi:hypothetical protein
MLLMAGCILYGEGREVGGEIEERREERWREEEEGG